MVMIWKIFSTRWNIREITRTIFQSTQWVSFFFVKLLASFFQCTPPIYFQNRKRIRRFYKIGLFNFMVMIWKIFSTRPNISEIIRTIFQSTNWVSYFFLSNFMPPFSNVHPQSFCRIEKGLVDFTELDSLFSWLWFDRFFFKAVPSILVKFVYKMVNRRDFMRIIFLRRPQQFEKSLSWSGWMFTITMKKFFWPSQKSWTLRQWFFFKLLFGIGTIEYMLILILILYFSDYDDDNYELPDLEEESGMYFKNGFKIY